jgi:hypothetical protein
MQIRVSDITEVMTELNAQMSNFGMEIDENKTKIMTLNSK